MNAVMPFCACGCGERVTMGTKRPYKPNRFVVAHRSRRPGTFYLEEDRGYETPCWIWQRAVGKNGYGYIRRESTLYSAHRFMYEKVVGPIPPGLHIDHLCRVRECCNPDHLEPVTLAENNRRQHAVRRLAA